MKLRRTIAERMPPAGAVPLGMLPRVLDFLRDIRPPLLVVGADRQGCLRELAEFSRQESRSVVVIDELHGMSAADRTWVLDEVQSGTSEHWVLVVTSSEEATSVWAEFPDEVTRRIAVLEVTAELQPFDHPTA